MHARPRGRFHCMYVAVAQKKLLIAWNIPLTSLLEDMQHSNTNYQPLEPMKDLNYRIDAQPPIRKRYRADREEQRRRRTEGDTSARRTIKLEHTTDMGRLAEVLSQDELDTLIKAEREMRQIRFRNRLSGNVPQSFWDAYETVRELRHTALKRIVSHYAYQAPEHNV